MVVKHHRVGIRLNGFVTITKPGGECHSVRPRHLSMSEGVPAP